LINNWFY